MAGSLLIATLAGPSAAAGQNLIEVRGADTRYRYADCRFGSALRTSSGLDGW